MVMSARRWSRRQGWMCSIVKSTASVLHRNVGIINHWMLDARFLIIMISVILTPKIM
jgi:hypothetical protein